MLMCDNIYNSCHHISIDCWLVYPGSILGWQRNGHVWVLDTGNDLNDTCTVKNTVS